MKSKMMIGVFSAGLLLTTSLIAMPHVKATGESETSIPAQIQNLQEQLGEIKDQVTGLLSTKDDIAALNKQVSEQQTQLDSMSKQIEALKTNPSSTSSTSLPKERLAFEGQTGATGTIRVFLVEKIDGAIYPVANQVIEVYDPKKPDDKLIGITNKDGLVDFTTRTDTNYSINYYGNEKYREALPQSTYGKNGTSIDRTYLYTLAY